MTAATVVLVLTLVMSDGTAYQAEAAMPDLQTCHAKAGEFLTESNVTMLLDDYPKVAVTCGIKRNGEKA